MADVIMAGFGGQGILTAGKILIEVAADNGKNVCWTSSYGAAMRGGTASCSIVVDDEEIGSPYPSSLDILVVMNEPSYEKFVGKVKDGGWIIINSSLVPEKNYPKNIHVCTVDATMLSNELGNGRAANLVMMGAMMMSTGLLDAEQFGDGLNNYFEKKKHNSPLNLECYKLGMSKSVILQ